MELEGITSLIISSGAVLPSVLLSVAGADSPFCEPSPEVLHAAKERAQKKKGDKMFHLEPHITVKDKLNDYAQAV